MGDMSDGFYLGGGPVGARRLTLARALLGGTATAAALPEIVRALGGDAGTCLRLAALFAIGTLASELPAAVLGDRAGEARSWLRRAGVVQALGLVGLALAPTLPWVALAVVVIGFGSGLSTGAEARASLSVGLHSGESSARPAAARVAQLEVVALLGKGTACCAVAIVAASCGLGARGAIAVAAVLALVAAFVSSTLRVGDRVHTVPRGRRRDARADADAQERDRRRSTSVGVIALVAGVAALTLAARGTDALDAFAISARGGTLVACAALLGAKTLIARALAPSIARARLHGVAIAGLVAAAPLFVAASSSEEVRLVAIAVACGIAGGAAAAARGVMLVRLGPLRVGTGAAVESTLRRIVLAVAAMVLAPVVAEHGLASPYVAASIAASVAATLGAIAVLLPRTIAHVRRLTV